MQVFGRVFPPSSLSAQFLCNFVALSVYFGLFYKILKRAPFLFSVKSFQSTRIVIRSQLFTDSPILFAGHVTGGKMQKARMVCRSYEFENIDRGIGVGGESVAQIGIEVR